MIIWEQNSSEGSAALQHRSDYVMARIFLNTVPPLTDSTAETADDDRAETEALRRTLHQLVYEEKIDPGRIAILGPRSLEHSGLAAHRILGPYALVDGHPAQRNRAESPVAGGDPDLPPGKTPIRYSTIHRFKGLEADIVLLTGVGVNSPHHGDEQTLIYVGASRARHRLFVFRRAITDNPETPP